MAENVKTGVGVLILSWDTDSHVLVYTCLQLPRLQSERRGVTQPSIVEARVEVNHLF